MKWLALLFLLGNLAFFGWRMNAPKAQPPTENPTASRSAHVNRLLLLSEVNSTELRQRGPTRARARDTSNADASGASNAQANSSDSQAAAADAVCLSIGPVAGEEEIGRMGAWLNERGGKTQLRPNERRELALYWLYLPPYPSKEDARQQVLEMKEKGVEDIFTIKNGDQANAISLGVYSRKTSLERRLAELKSKGYTPQVAPRYRQKKATWYDVRFPLGYAFPADRFTLAFPAAQYSEATCTAQVTQLKPSGLPTADRRAG